MGQAENLGELSSATGLPDTSDAIEIAMAAVNQSQPLPDIARTVLEKHARLLDKQAHELDLKHVSERVQAGLWLMVAAGMLMLIGLIGWAAWRAANTQALVVEPFAMPPALAAQGLTGEVAATRTLDEVKRMLESRSSARPAASYENDWGDDLKIDIPNTGLTLDQGWKLLRRTLGKETRFSGDVVQMGGRAVIAVRIAGGNGRRFTAPAEDIEQLFVAAAEFVLRETQPYRFGVYLSQFPGRATEQQNVLQALAADASPVERVWATNGLGVLERRLGNISESERWLRKAIADAPDFMLPYGNLAGIQWSHGRWQEALSTWRRAPAQSREFRIEASETATLPCIYMGGAAWLTRDRQALGRSAFCLSSATARAAACCRDGANLGWVEMAGARMDHDATAARTAALNAGEPSGRGGQLPLQRALRQLEVAIETGDPATISDKLLTLDDRERDAVANPQNGGQARANLATANNPIRAEAEILLRRFDRAAALLAGAPADCLPCTSARAKLAQAQGDAQNAALAYDAAVKLAPSLPHPLVDRGRFLLGQRKWAAAEANFRAAERLSVEWADPQKFLGDALAAQGRIAEAKAAWTEAVKRAPKWAEAQAALAAAKI